MYSTSEASRYSDDSLTTFSIFSFFLIEFWIEIVSPEKEEFTRKTPDYVVKKVSPNNGVVSNGGAINVDNFGLLQQNTTAKESKE